MIKMLLVRPIESKGDGYEGLGMGMIRKEWVLPMTPRLSTAALLELLDDRFRPNEVLVAPN